STTATLTIGADNAADMKITNTAGCSGGSWEPFSTSKSWPLASSNATNTVYISVRNGGHVSGCVSDSITHDNQDPDGVTNLTLSVGPQGLTQSPTIAYTLASDNGPSGISRHEVAVHLASDNSLVEAYQTHTAGTALSGLNLTDGTQYYVKVRAIDNAGNVGAEVSSSNWTATENLIATLSGVPSDLDPDEVLDVTVGGDNITEYYYKVGEDSSINCSSASGYLGPISTSTKITTDISGLSDGDVTLCVRGSNGVDTQLLAEATSATWTKVPQNAPPVLDSVGDFSIGMIQQMTPVDVGNDGGDDFDSDNEAITYSCHFDLSVNGSVAELGA